jgi:hypothetical protein
MADVRQRLNLNRRGPKAGLSLWPLTLDEALRVIFNRTEGEPTVETEVTEVVETAEPKKKVKSAKHVEASKKVKRRRKGDSEALFAAAQASRLRQPVLVTGVKFASHVTVIQYADFGRLNIDRDKYQRGEHRIDVNTLITIIKSGGQIPSPIDIAERPNGTWWIVDGQQRFLAHEAAKVPIKAHIHLVENVEAEERLFVALNSRRPLSPRTVIKGWPGLFGQFIRRMNTDEKSPVRGMVDLATNSHLPLDATVVLSGVLAVTTGSLPHGDTITSRLPRADMALKSTIGMAWAEAFVYLIAAVFGTRTGGRRVRVLPVLALARVAHRKYMAAGRPVFPKSCARLHATNWDTIVPSHARQYLPLIEQRIEKLWK